MDRALLQEDQGVGKDPLIEVRETVRPAALLRPRGPLRKETFALTARLPFRSERHSRPTACVVQVKRGVTEGHHIDNIALEVNGVKFAYASVCSWPLWPLQPAVAQPATVAYCG